MIRDSRSLTSTLYTSLFLNNERALFYFFKASVILQFYFIPLALQFSFYSFILYLTNLPVKNPHVNSVAARMKTNYLGIILFYF